MGIRDRLQGWEAHADAWAAKRLSAEEMAEAKELDAYLRESGWRVAGAYLAFTVVLAALLVGAKPALGAGRAFFLANLICGAILVALVAVWFGHRRRGRKSLWQASLAVIAITCAGSFAGAMIGRGTWERVAALGTEDLVRMASVGLLTGLAMAAVLGGITWIRGREARARQAMLAAEAERERLEKRNREAELRLLQAQLEPHFLFNTLANLRYLVQKGSGEALPMLDHLIDYLRTALPGIREAESTLGREASLARAYLEIIRIRMGGELTFEIDLPAALESRPIPPLLLMTLVENAVKHGIAPVGRGHVRLSVAASDGRLAVRVEDDGRGLAEDMKPGVGLANVRERIASLHGAQAALVLRPREGGGAVAELTLPDRTP